jgi:hypothetical protein
MDFRYLGVTCQTPSKLFFDYKCGCCGFEGRWTLGMVVDVVAASKDCGPLEALKTMIEVIEYDKDEQRGIVLDKLNKVHGISDLFKLGGKNAPRERKARKG